jgi:hypothetical protein
MYTMFDVLGISIPHKTQIRNKTKLKPSMRRPQDDGAGRKRKPTRWAIGVAGASTRTRILNRQAPTNKFMKIVWGGRASPPIGWRASTPVDWRASAPAHSCTVVKCMQMHAGVLFYARHNDKLCSRSPRDAVNSCVAILMST